MHLYGCLSELELFQMEAEFSPPIDLPEDFFPYLSDSEASPKSIFTTHKSANNNLMGKENTFKYFNDPKGMLDSKLLFQIIQKLRWLLCILVFLNHSLDIKHYKQWSILDLCLMYCVIFLVSLLVLPDNWINVKKYSQFFQNHIDEYFIWKIFMAITILSFAWKKYFGNSYLNGASHYQWKLFFAMLAITSKIVIYCNRNKMLQRMRILNSRKKHTPSWTKSYEKLIEFKYL